MSEDEIEAAAAGLNDFEKEWLTGWKGPPAAAYNVVATDLVRKGLLLSSSNWNLSPKGQAVRNALWRQAEAYRRAATYAVERPEGGPTEVTLTPEQVAEAVAVWLRLKTRP